MKKPTVPTFKAAQNLQNLLAKRKVGETIPGQHDLARILGVSRPTVRSLLQRYLDEKILTSRRGQGTFLIRPVKASLLNAEQILNVGIVVLKFDIPWVARMIRAFEKVEQDLDVNLILKSSGDSGEREIEMLSQLWRTGIRRIITFPSWGNDHNPEYHKMLANMQSSESLIVSIDRSIQGFDVPCVSMDNVQAGYLLASYLIQRKHRNILMIGPFEDNFSLNLDERLYGYRNALKDAGIPRRNEFVLDTSRLSANHPTEAAYLALREYLGRHGLNFTAVIGAHDDFAWGAVKALKEAGISIPKQVSVVGIDNNREEVFGIPLTTMDHPVDKIARLAMRIVCDTGGDLYERSHHSLFSPILIERESAAMAPE